MDLKQKIQIAHSQLPLPSEVSEDEIVCTIRQHKFIQDFPFLESQEVSTTETHLIFQKEYTAGMAIGWTFAKKVKEL